MPAAADNIGKNQFAIGRDEDENYFSSLCEV
jgi:hypothetical protein